MKRTKRWLALLLAGMLAIPQMSVVKAEETVDLSYEGYEPFVTAVETPEELDAIEEILSDTVSLPGAEEISSQEEELSDRPADVPVYVEAGQTTAPSREKLIQYIEKNGEKEPDGWGGELYTCSLQSSMGGYVSLIWYAPKKELVLSYENSIETEGKRLFPSISVNLPENMNDPVHATFAIQSGAYGMAETVFYSANYHGTEDMNFVTLKSSFVYTTDAELHAEANKWLKNGYKVWDEALKKAIGEGITGLGFGTGGQVTPPPAPALDKTTITGFYNSVKGADIRWTYVANCEGYKVYRFRAAEGETLVAEIEDSRILQCYDPAIRDNCWGRVYTYYIYPISYSAAYPPRGEKSESVTLQRLAPMKIVSFKNNTAGAIDLAWTCTVNDNKAYGYEIQYATSKTDLFGQKGTFKKISVNGRNSLTKKISGLSKGQTYYFRIRCYVNYTHSVTGKQTKTWSQYSDVVSVKITK